MGGRRVCDGWRRRRGMGRHHPSWRRVRVWGRLVSGEGSVGSVLVVQVWVRLKADAHPEWHGKRSSKTLSFQYHSRWSGDDFCI